MEVLLANGADVMGGKDEGECAMGPITPMHSAAMGGHAACLEVLASNGADMDAIDTDGHTPLSYAASGGHVACVEVLIAKGAEVGDALCSAEGECLALLRAADEP